MRIWFKPCKGGLDDMRVKEKRMGAEAPILTA
jgi:hypothetical protein